MGISLVVAAALFVATCGNERAGDPFSPEVEVETRTVALECSADVARGTVECAAPSGMLPSGARGALTLGGQGINVLLASSNVCFEAQCEPAAPAGIFQADVTVKNLIGQALGTVDGETVHEDGVRVFFHSGPVVTATTDGQGGSVVVHNADGVGLFTASDQPYFQYDEVLGPNETSAAKTWQWLLSSNVQSFQFGVLVSAEVQYPEGWIDITPAVDTIVVGAPDSDGTLQLAAVVRDRLGAVLADEEVSWASSDEAKATVDETGLVTAVGDTGLVTITASAGVRTGTALVYLAPYRPPLVARNDMAPFSALGNVSISSVASGYRVTANDEVPEGATITFVGWNGVAGKTQQGGDVSMTTSGAGMGEFTYNPPAGFNGVDGFSYVLSAGLSADTAIVSVAVSGMIWFIDNNAAACTSVASGCGRLSNPFSSLDAFRAANDNTGNNPGDGDVIFIYESATEYTASGAVTLRPGQKLIGQDATSPSWWTLVGISEFPGSAPLPAANSGNSLRVTLRPSGGLVLGSNNMARGFSVTNLSGIGIRGQNFGTLTLGGDVEVSTRTGTAVSLTTGTVNGAFRSISAELAPNGIVLSGVAGTFEVTGRGTAGSGGIIRNTSGDGISISSSGPVRLAWMVIESSGDNGIRGTAVSGFTLRRSTLRNNGNAQDEHGLRFTQLTGTVRIDTVGITGSYHTGLYIANSSGTLNLTLQGDTVSKATLTTNATLDEAGVRIEATGSATINVVAGANTIRNHDDYNFTYTARGGAGGSVAVTNNQFGATNGRSIQILGGLGDAAGVWSGTLVYNVSGNSIQNVGQVAAAVGAVTSGFSGSARGRVQANTVGASAVQGSCGQTGLEVRGDGSGTHVSEVTNNVLYSCRDLAISVTADGATARHDAVVRGNSATTVPNPSAPNSETFRANVESGTLCLAAGHPTNPADKNRLDHRIVPAGSHDLVVDFDGPSPASLILEGYTGAPNDRTAATNFLRNSNDYIGGGPANVAILSAPAGTTITAGTCLRPW